MTSKTPILLFSLLFALACGDDDATGDAGASPDAAADAVAPDDAGMDDAGADDAGTNDAGTDDAGADDAGPGECPEGAFDLSEATIEIPFAIPDEFSGESETWMRPVDGCPAETTDGPVPFVAYTYCNGRDVATDYTFGMQTDDDPSDIEPVLVAYSGAEVPADTAMCGAFEEALGDFTAIELIVTLEPGEVVTIVSTSRTTGEGTFLSVAGPSEEK